MSLSAADQDLANLAAASRLDATLGVLASLASSGGELMLGLLLNGMTVYGRTVTPREFFAKLDNEHASMKLRSERQQKKPWPPGLASQVDGAWVRMFEEREDDYQGLIARNSNVERDDFSEEDARAAIEHTATTLTLAGVTVVPPAGPQFEIPLMRVRLAQVAGWWVIPVDAAGSATVTHPMNAR